MVILQAIQIEKMSLFSANFKQSRLLFLLSARIIKGSCVKQFLFYCGLGTDRNYSLRVFALVMDSGHKSDQNFQGRYQNE